MFLSCTAPQAQLESVEAQLVAAARAEGGSVAASAPPKTVAEERMLDIASQVSGTADAPCPSVTVERC